MKRLSMSYDEFKAELLKNKNFKEEYEALEPRYQVIEQIIAARQSQHVTQKELAKRIGTQTSNISRLESGNYNPSVDFLYKVAKGLNMRLDISLRIPKK